MHPCLAYWLMYSLLIMLDWDIQRRGEYNHPEPNPQQNIPLYLSSTQVSFWHTGCLMFGGSHSHVSSLQLMLLVRCAGWTCSCSSLPGTMSCWCLTPWSCWLTLSWPSTSYRHGVWTTMTKVLIQGMHHALCSNDFFRCTIQRTKNGDCVQAAPHKWTLDHLPSLTSFALDVICHHIFQTFLFWGSSDCEPVHIIGDHHSVYQVTSILHWTLDIINIHHKSQLLFSVMEKLPATSYVRLVDVWLIFGQLLPFIEEASSYAPDLLHVLIYLFKGGVIHNCWALQWWRYNQSSWFSKEGDYRISEEHSCNAINDLQRLQNSKSVG